MAAGKIAKLESMYIEVESVHSVYQGPGRTGDKQLYLMF